MDNESSNPSKKGWLKRAFSGALGVVKELTIHSMIHFTVWGTVFAANFAGALGPIFTPLGDGLTYLSEQVGLEGLFSEANAGGAITAKNNSDLVGVPEFNF